MFLKLFLIFTVIPVIELYVLIRIGSIFGALNTVLLVILTGILGAYLSRREGFAVWRRVQTQLRGGVFPADELIEGLLILIAGIVLITPGVLTDAAGFIILFPFTRSMMRELIKRKLRDMKESGNTDITGFFF
ncbi:MAG: FxsA family protein [Fibrobacterota bacterium]